MSFIQKCEEHEKREKLFSLLLSLKAKKEEKMYFRKFRAY